MTPDHGSNEIWARAYGRAFIMLFSFMNNAGFFTTLFEPESSMKNSCGCVCVVFMRTIKITRHNVLSYFSLSLE